MYVNTFFVCHVMSLGLPVVRRRYIRGWSAANRLVWIGMLGLTCGRLVGSWITGTESICSITIGMGVIFLITNSVNKQINIPPRL